jgi:hypothetical protein
MRDTHTPVFSILICPAIDQEISDFQASCTGAMSCEPLCKDSNWVKYFYQKVKRALDTPFEEENKLGKVDIFLDKPQYSMSGKGFAFNVPMNTLKDMEDFYRKDLIQRSREFTELKKWDKALEAIGGYLLRELFQKNPEFQAHFTRIIAEAGGVENIRIRYIVEEKIHPLALEALVDEHNEFHMLHCPVFRSVNAPCSNPPLFRDKETREHPVNCLIINANSHGEPEWGKDAAPDVPLKLAPLKNAAKETLALGKLFRGYKKKGGPSKNSIDKVSRLSPRKGEPDFFKRVEKILGSDTWHIVHFAGHSHYDEKSQKGYVFFPGKRSQPIPVEIDDFARDLCRTDVRLVYLSSCSSADVDFVFTLSKKNIPATLGFRCPIDDDKAMEHALVFYEKLFLGSKRLEYAFLETRKELAINRRYQKNNYIWAASILTMQSGD